MAVGGSDDALALVTVGATNLLHLGDDVACRGGLPDGTSGGAVLPPYAGRGATTVRADLLGDLPEWWPGNLFPHPPW